MRNFLFTIVIATITSASAFADVAPTYIEVSCNPQQGKLSISYTPHEKKTEDEASILIEKFRVDSDLIESKGSGWASKTVTRTCSNGSEHVTITLTGLSYNMSNSNGLGGAAFYTDVTITSDEMLYFRGRMDKDEFLPPVNMPIVKSVKIDLTTHLITVIQLARAGH